MLTIVPDQTKAQETLLNHASMLEKAIVNFINAIPDNNERNHAWTNFQQALMWSGCSIRRNPPEEEKRD